MSFSGIVDVHYNDPNEQIDEDEMCKHDERDRKVLTVRKLFVRCFLDAYPTLKCEEIQ